MKRSHSSSKSANMLSFLSFTNLPKSDEGTKKISSVKKEWVCCVCSSVLKLDNDMNNLHLDGCLKNEEKKRLSESRKCEKKQDVSRISIPNELLFLPCVPSGIICIYDFLSEEEEKDLISDIDKDSTTPWQMSSWNGNYEVKSFGIKTQFGLGKEVRAVRRNDLRKGEHDIPDYCRVYMDRFHAIKHSIVEYILSQKNQRPYYSKMAQTITAFVPNECNVNSYRRDEGQCLHKHFDDRFLSGPVLLNLSLGGRAKMTFSPAATAPRSGGGSGATEEVGKSEEGDVIVNLPRRCLQLVTGDARYRWTHCIPHADLLDERRVSITWRQANTNMMV